MAEEAPARPVVALALEEQHRWLANQQATLASVHQRAIALVATAGVVVGLVGPRALEGGAEWGTSDVALATLAGLTMLVAVALALWLLVPTTWRWSCTSDVLLGPQWSALATVEDAQGALAKELADAAKVNSRKLDRRAWAFAGAVVALVTSTALWLVLILARS